MTDPRLDASTRLRRIIADPDVRLAVNSICKRYGVRHWSELLHVDPDNFVNLVGELEQMVEQVENPW